MTFRRGDEDGIDWRIASKIILMPMIGILLSILAWFILDKLASIEASIKEIQAGQAGIMRENQLQDERITSLRGELESHIKMIERDKGEYEALRQDYYRRFGYISTTRGGKDILLSKPFQQ